MDEIDPFKLSIELQLSLPRNGPGSARATRDAFSLLPPLPAAAEILDAGCGQAPEAFDLLPLIDGRITALDLFEPFLAKAQERAEREGVPESRLFFKRGDMEHLPFAHASFDLIWSEGAIYLLGFERGLELWRPFVKQGGFVVVSECTWLVDRRSVEVDQFWEEAYPTMGTIAENSEAARRAGYKIIGTRILPEEDLWDNYYTPMQTRLSTLAAEWAGAGDAAMAMLRESEREIALFARYAGEYSYVFYVLKRL
jgi:SAM-dependent methyltransferase